MNKIIEKIGKGNILWMMEIHDLNIDPSLQIKYELFSKWSLEHDTNISYGEFHPFTTKDSVIKAGEEYHSVLYKYLSDKVFIRGDLDFDKP